MHSGNVGHAQDLDSLISASKLLDDLDDLSVAIVGGGARHAELVALARELGADRVRFLPYQPRETLAESLSAADVHVVGLARGLAGYVVPSRLYGVLAVARPVICAADAESETAQLVERVGCGIVVEPGRPDVLADAIRRAHSGELDLAELGSRGRDYVTREADRRVAVRRYRELFDELLHDPLKGVEGVEREAAEAAVERAVVQPHRLLEAALRVRARYLIRAAFPPVVEEEGVGAVPAAQPDASELACELVLLPVHARPLVEAAHGEELVAAHEHRRGADRVGRSRELARDARARVPARDRVARPAAFAYVLTASRYASPATRSPCGASLPSSPRSFGATKPIDGERSSVSASLAIESESVRYVSGLRTKTYGRLARRTPWFTPPRKWTFSAFRS